MTIAWIKEDQQAMQEASRTIKRHEGWRLNPYRCSAGKLTIGYGRNLDDVGISKQEAEVLLDNDISKTRDSLMMFPWWRFLDIPRKTALIDMAYNLGMTRFNSFKRMIAALEVRDYETAAKEMLGSKWHSQVGQRARTLALIMETGKMSEDVS